MMIFSNDDRWLEKEYSVLPKCVSDEFIGDVAGVCSLLAGYNRDRAYPGSNPELPELTTTANLRVNCSESGELHMGPGYVSGLALSAAKTLCYRLTTQFVEEARLTLVQSNPGTARSIKSKLIVCL